MEKKKKLKLILILIIIAVLLLLTLIIFENHFSKKKSFDCNNIIFLRQSELNQASLIAKETNALILIPEKHQIIGNVDFLKNCPNFNPLDYLGVNKKRNLNDELNNLENSKNFDGSYELNILK